MTSRESDYSKNPSDDLFLALKESLERRGVLDPIRAILRTQTLQSLEIASRAEEFTRIHSIANENDVSMEMNIANELFIDYLSSRRFDQTLSVFRAEIGRKEERLDLKYNMENELFLANTTCSKCCRPHDKEGNFKVPWIYRLIEKVRNHEKNH